MVDDDWWESIEEAKEDPIEVLDLDLKSEGW